MRHSLALLSVLLIGCGSNQPTPSQSVSVVDVDARPRNETVMTYVPPTPTIPEPDRYFESGENMAAWIDSTVHVVQELKNAPRPEPELDPFKHFTLKPENLAGDVSLWKIAEDNRFDPVEMPPVLLSDAINLEAGGERLAAGEKFAELGKTDDVHRCLESLRKDGEWKAVAMLAILLDDTKSLDHATDILMKDDHVSRTKDLIDYAVTKQHASMADHLAERHHFNVAAELSVYVLEDLARQGAVRYYADYVEARIGTEYYKEDSFTKSILMVAKHDRARALQLAEKYLGWKDVSVLIEYCEGECSNKPQPGVIELYDLIKDNERLRQLFVESFGRLWERENVAVQDWYNKRGNTDSRSQFSSALALLVKETGDQDLIAAMRAGLDSEPPCIEREVSILMLGGTPVLEEDGLKDHETFLLEWAMSHEIPSREIPTSDAMDWAIQFIARGDITLDLLKWEWGRLGLPTGIAGKKYTREEADQAIELVKKGGIGGAATMQIIQDVALSGFTVPLDLNFEEVTPEFAYVLATQGRMDEAKRILLNKAYARYSEAYLDEHFALQAVEALLGKMLETAEGNAEVVKRGGEAVLPCDRESAYELIADSLATLRQDRRDAYLRVVVELARKYYWLYERESEQLAKAGEIALLQDLANAINRVVQTT
jgi:hypothetical protein